MATWTTIRPIALPFAVFGVGSTSTSKCVPSRTAIVAPSMMSQMRQKRAASSVQM